ncbi:MAG TPA: glycosyl hydrolase [Sphingobium sp.]|uniref:glycosyl hydrolase n=1 Tax=Sphingobium sp. TaxID=1912891 RepID=UPI002ED328B2
MKSVDSHPSLKPPFKRLWPFLAATILALPLSPARASSESDSLLTGFENPPQEARPRLWWHWMSGNITEEGARLDLEWMKRIGIGGVHIFTGGKFPEPRLVNPPNGFMTDGWKTILRQSVTTARASGMEVAISSTPGWSVTGGPWVAPQDAMKKYVWSELTIDADGKHPVLLPQPPHVTGPFQGKIGDGVSQQAYGEAAVIAFPTPALEQVLPSATWKSAAGALDMSSIGSPDLKDIGAIKVPWDSSGAGTWIEADFAGRERVGAVSLGAVQEALVTIQAETAPAGFVTVAETRLEASQGTVDHPAPRTTVGFSPVLTGRLRIVFRPVPKAKDSSLASVAPVADKGGVTLTHLSLIGGARVDAFEAKAGFAPVAPARDNSVDIPSGNVVDGAKVIDISRHLRADGSLDWIPPAGRWTIMRFGWSLTGKVNAPAEPSATGLEVDKFDPAAVRRYMTRYLDMYEQATGKGGGAGINGLLTDSWEAGVQNWTPRMVDEFTKRRGYDPLRFLPVLAGRVVGSMDQSEKFLFDFRQTLKDLVADNHYGVIASEVRARGMTYYTEALGDSPRAIADGMTIKSRADIPTAEFWYRPFSTLPGQPPLKADLEEAASAAHVYGKALVAAEALTVAAISDPWSFSPSMLKPVADEIFARGVNRILLHESHAQPLVDAKPGLALFIWGQYFNRNETWAERAAPWISYLSRTSFLLQQGKPVVDIAYFYGEEQNLTEQFVERVNSDVPVGYAYDYINPEALLTLLDVRDGQIVTPSGMRYSLLYIPDHIRNFSKPVVQRLDELVRKGATLVARRPTGSLGLPASDANFEALVAELWGKGDEKAREVGSGRVYASIEDALSARHLGPDISFGPGVARGDILSNHRKTKDADIYFVSNQTDHAQHVTAQFRVSDRTPELWKADTGAIAKLSYVRDNAGIGVPLALAPHEAAFVIFRQPLTIANWTAPLIRQSVLTTLGGPWTVSFEAGRGAPGTRILDRLSSLSEASDPGIRYFSGAATYSRSFTVPGKWLKSGRRVEIDLGDVREIATISVNGKRTTTAWHAPYRADITDALRKGKNKLEVEVINLWPNRLIGDKQPGTKPVAFAPTSPYRANSPLLASGLIGPVHILASEEVVSTGVNGGGAR